MRTTRLVFTLSFNSLLLLWAAAIAFADEPAFSVESFIPERFTDFEWLISGELDINGQQNDQTWFYPRTPENISHNGNSGDHQLLGIRNWLKYQYTTIPRSLTFSLAFYGAAANDNSNSSSWATNNPNADQYYNGRSHTLLFQIAPDLVVQQYLDDDLFIAAGIKGFWSITEIPRDDFTERVREDDNIHYDSVLISISERENEGTTSIKSYAVEAQIFSGWGRTYDGRFATTALNMINELRRHNLLRREPTRSEKTALTKLIYQYRLKHAVDDRLHRIEALSAFLDYLIEEGISDPGPYGYALIQDIWDYFPRDIRLFGFSFHTGPGIIYQQLTDRHSLDLYSHSIKSTYPYNFPDSQITIYDYEYSGVHYFHDREAERSIYWAVGADYYKPLNLRWQIDFGGEWRYFPEAYILNETHRIYYTDGGSTFGYYGNGFAEMSAYHKLNLFLSVRYLIDSRTRADFGMTYDRTHFNTSILTYSRFNKSEFGENIDHDHLTFGGLFTYRISIPTTLTVTAHYMKDNIEGDGRFILRVRNESDGDYNLSLGISHYLF